MKFKKSILLFMHLFLFLSAMEVERPQKAYITFITAEEQSVPISVEQFEQLKKYSGTIKNMAEDIVELEDKIPLAPISSQDLIHVLAMLSHFKMHEGNEKAQKEKIYKELKAKNLTSEQLANLIKTINYLDIQSLLFLVPNLFIEQISTDETLNKFNSETTFEEFQKQLLLIPFKVNISLKKQFPKIWERLMNVYISKNPSHIKKFTAHPNHLSFPLVWGRYGLYFIVIGDLSNISIIYSLQSNNYKQYKLKSWIASVIWMPFGRSFGINFLEQEKLSTILDMQSGEESKQYANIQNKFNVIDLNSDGTEIAGARDGEIKIFDALNVTLLRTKIIGYDKKISKIKWSPDGKKIAIVFKTAISIWDTSNDKITKLDSSSDVLNIAWSPDSKKLVVVRTASVSLYDESIEFKISSKLDKVAGLTNWFLIHWKPDSSAFTLLTQKGRDNIGDMVYWENGSFSTKKTGIKQIAWSKDGSKVASIPTDNNVINIKKAQNQDPLVDLDIPNQPGQLIWSPDGTKIAYMPTISQPIIWWDLANPEYVQAIRDLSVLQTLFLAWLVEKNIDFAGELPDYLKSLYATLPKIITETIMKKSTEEREFGELEFGAALDWKLKKALEEKLTKKRRMEEEPEETPESKKREFRKE